MRAFKNSIRQEVAKHFAEFFLKVEPNLEHVNLNSSTAVLRRFIDWNEVEQRDLLAEAKRFLETGEFFPRGTAEEAHAPDAEAEASDSEPMEPLADDHSSDGEDTPNCVEESAAPPFAAAPKRAAMSLLQRLQAIRIKNGSRPPSVVVSLSIHSVCVNGVAILHFLTRGHFIQEDVIGVPLDGLIRWERGHVEKRSS